MNTYVAVAKGWLMQSRIKIVRTDEVVTLTAVNGGRALVWIVMAEIVLLGTLLWQLAAVVSAVEILALPVMASLGLLGWTIAQIRPDYRMTLDLAAREGSIVRISPVTGAYTAATFPLQDVEGLSLLQTATRPGRKSSWQEYVVALELRDGARHILSQRGPMLAYRRDVEMASAAAGLATRVVRLAGR
jgi:hypothetical protein